MSEMTTQPIETDIDAVERALRNACRLALFDGIVLVQHAFEVTDDRGRLVGCCAWGALGLHPRLDHGARLTSDEYDAIELGWDGEEGSGPWWMLGARLAAEFKPVPAESLEAR